MQMNFYSPRTNTSPDQPVPLLDWRPDLVRFEQEVHEAQRAGYGDPLTLAEMECSLDLIDADLLALRSDRHPDDKTRQMIDEWVDLRGRLVRLILAMKPLAQS